MPARARARITIDFAALKRILSQSEPLRTDMESLAARGEAIAKSIAPVRTGHYRDGLKHETASRAVKARGPDGSWSSFQLPLGRVVGTDWKTRFVEFGTPHNPARHTLRNTLSRLGIR